MLTALAPDLWEITADHWMSPVMHFPVRCVVVRLADGGLWLHSPVAFDASTVQALTALGPVRWIVAPSLMHDAYLAAAHAHWPDATLVAPADLAAKHPDLPIAQTPLDAAPAWQDQLTVVPIDGAPMVQEHVFIHHPSASLIVTDLLFHIHASPAWLSRMVFRLVGAWKRLAQSKAWRWVFTKDRAAAGASVRAMLAYPVTRLVPAHGQVLTAPDLTDQLTGALQWMLSAAPALTDRTSAEPPPR